MPPMGVESHRPVRSRFAVAALLSLALLTAGTTQGQSLLGSRSSLLRQSRGAQEHDYSYLRTGGDVHEFVRRGLLVKLRGNSDYRLASVSYPYARPEVKTFVERLADQYRAACRDRLIVTSLTRPITRQPRNASHLSVHPTGMAVDLRRSTRPACRAWLEDTLLTLESRGVVEATREKHPPHYHVTLFPRNYESYLANTGRVVTASNKDTSGSKTVSAARASSKKYRVGRGDNLWSIAKRHRTSVASIKRYNGINSTRLKPGQVLQIPVTRSAR